VSGTKTLRTHLKTVTETVLKTAQLKIIQNRTLQKTVTDSSEKFRDTAVAEYRCGILLPLFKATEADFCIY
jgi:hypothetical protein